MATLDWDGLVFYDQQIKKHIDKILDKYASKTYVADEIAKATTGIDLTIYAKTSDVDTKLTNYVKKTDAFSGDYNDLNNKPDIANLATKKYVTDEIAKVSTGGVDLTGYAKTSDVDTKLTNYVKKADAFNGDYNNLTNKPTIPDVTNLATKVELNNHVGSTKHITDDERTKWNGYNDTINTMKTNFEDGVNTIYNAVVAKGITPSDKRPSSIVNAIERLILMISKGPLLTYTFETGSPMMPSLNGKSHYINFCKDTDNGDGTTTRKLYVETEVNQIHFGKEKGTSNIISLDNTASIKLNSTNRMFKNCVKLRSVNLSNLDTSNVTNIDYMFCNCTSLTSLDLHNFDTSKVTSMQETFRLCKSLTSLYLRNFDTSNVTNMSYIFSGCTSLASLDISSFNTSKVTSMRDMFSECTSLTSLDVSNFDTSKATDMRYTFKNCTSLTSLDLHNFDTSKVDNMEGMFNECASLTSLDLSNFNTPQLYAIDYMFCNCTSLTSLDLSNLSTENVEYSYSMFTNVQSTCTIRIDKTKFTKTEADCNFAGTFTDVSTQG